MADNVKSADAPRRTLMTYISGTLKGAGQVMFQGSP